ncbi:D-2-hydroxyacid dehydrogenase [Sediminitomix flava]|uniref:Glycerate dehydrogenase n=1 Tax=Sediminitomix flava TaxID=379075 RepID=A0A315ZB91_SEDFL|nr:D-2-hydroxyacid dehydrogenase [Sediminitomix flava]PWJ42078.1 glycerate dehydrogenase [Sediminitomix flava]
MNIVFLDRETLGDTDVETMLAHIGAVKIYQSTKKNEVIDRCKESDIILTNKVRIDKEVIDHCPKLKLICVTATGMNNVDLEYARYKGIGVKNVSGYSSNSVAQITLSLALNFLAPIGYYNDYVKSGAYAQNNSFTHLGMPIEELSNKKIGVIGLGAIGKRVAELFSAFGAKVYYYSSSGIDRSDVYERLELDELLDYSDIITIHAPLNSKTENLIAKDELLKMKSSAILINTGRGGIVNEEDLVEALKNNVIRAAAIDVYAHEPIKSNHKFLELQSDRKLILTPHIAWASEISRKNLMNGVVENIQDFLKKNKKANR